MGWLRGVLRLVSGAVSREVRELVGTDHLGNKYYYIAPYKNWRGQTIREKRFVEAANKKEVDYEAGDIPTEWEAWIRRTRKTPPTMEGTGQWWLQKRKWLATLELEAVLSEILKNEKYREEIKIKSKEFYEKDKLGKETREELLPSPAATQIKGHASAPYFGKEEPSVAPTSTGQTFQPGSWMPEDGKR
ncbi:NADH dehydrogenase [ubiquinone] 1 alpha subcomplex assembly factor 2 isoform X2 [Meriones unguiculatus]|uniref:NADH dehydrogenase [ubiquinone] 1 alpha subcomplex assembly factor 2 isoform X2 n=1 Tax=Meriones unguiculatus TaxID=10047 RepID=UPI00293E6AB6|nr:NADH dehydrogenase [ubiquinone] 1 alpha subcomplex assembly factor 2 isoform X2 [Meriones unguiculatus]